MKPKKIIVIGSGFAGLCAAGLLAQKGHSVTLLEKNDQTGGRARTWKSNGFTFDMGPSWYWMPEVFEEYFQMFGKTVSDFYELERLDPGYRIYFTGNQQMDVPANIEQLKAAFEKREPGSARQLEVFLKDAEYKYHTAMTDYVKRLSDSPLEFLEPRLILKSLQLNLFSSLRKQVRKRFKDPLLVSLLEFPVLFLGSTPDKTPALYSMMNYADLVKGTWFPKGGMSQIAKAFTKVAESVGVNILLNKAVTHIETNNNKASKVWVNNEVYEADIVVAGSDYQHTEQMLLKPEARVYTKDYWDSRTMSPSSLLYFVGINKKIKGLLHHNLFFDEDFETHAQSIYSQPDWPAKPLFYLNITSITDSQTAPPDCENLFFLIPLAPELKDSDETREHYFNIMMERLEKKTGQSIKGSIIVKRSYAMNDFVTDYNAYKGNAYGLANTLMQTAFLKPKIKSKKINNLFYTGQLTVPGPGVPPAIISGKIVADEILKQIEKNIL
ncbi:MAG: phytoene desaturase family protein [Bacteroidota bacterium]